MAGEEVRVDDRRTATPPEGEKQRGGLCTPPRGDEGPKVGKRRECYAGACDEGEIYEHGRGLVLEEREDGIPGS